MQYFSTAQILERHVNHYFEIKGKQMNKIAKTVKFKNYKTKIKSRFMIYSDFENIKALEINGMQNPDESCMSKYQNHVGCSFYYKLVCVDDQFSKSFK